MLAQTGFSLSLKVKNFSLKLGMRIAVGNPALTPPSQPQLPQTDALEEVCSVKCLPQHFHSHSGETLQEGPLQIILWLPGSPANRSNSKLFIPQTNG